MRHFTSLFVASLALFLLVAEPALAQSIDLSPIQSLLQGIVDALTGPLGVVIATLAVLGVFLSWFFNIIDLRQALWVLVGIAGVAAAPTIVAAVSYARPSFWVCLSCMRWFGSLAQFCCLSGCSTSSYWAWQSCTIRYFGKPPIGIHGSSTC